VLVTAFTPYAFVPSPSSPLAGGGPTHRRPSRSTAAGRLRPRRLTEHRLASTSNVARECSHADSRAKCLGVESSGGTLARSTWREGICSRSTVTIRWWIDRIAAAVFRIRRNCDYICRRVASDQSALSDSLDQTRLAREPFLNKATATILSPVRLLHGRHRSCRGCNHPAQAFVGVGAFASYRIRRGNIVRHEVLPDLIP
jgi:hypothetical protein